MQKNLQHEDFFQAPHNPLFSDTPKQISNYISQYCNKRVL